MIANPLVLYLVRGLARDVNASIDGRGAARRRPDREWFTVRAMLHAVAESCRARIGRAMPRRPPAERLDLPGCDCTA